MSHLVYDIDFLERLAVERLDPELEGVVYLLVALSDSGVHDLVGREAAGVSVKHFVSADAVSTKAFVTDIFQKPSLHVNKIIRSPRFV